MTTTPDLIRENAVAYPKMARLGQGALACRIRRTGTVFFLRVFFCLAERAPSTMEAWSGAICDMVLRVSPAIRNGTLANARRILGPAASKERQANLARQVVRSFYLFCCDMGRSLRATPEELLKRVEWIGGHDTFLATRQQKRGVIVVTAHMGSFEVGLAALAAMETDIHVVFRRDQVGQFERRRSQLRRRLGVHEAPLDEGWTVWMRLRDALLKDHAVVLQGDRVLPGQKGQLVPFLGGHIELPTGPIKLALATGAPILPVFTVRAPDGGIRLFVEDPIEMAKDGSESDPDVVYVTLLKLKSILEKFVRAYPQQWLILDAAWNEDKEDGGKQR